MVLYGITYPEIFDLEAWAKIQCPKGHHLFDEVGGSSDEEWSHYLSCDACGLMVGISRISDEYVEKKHKHKRK